MLSSLQRRSTLIIVDNRPNPIFGEKGIPFFFFFFYLIALAAPCSLKAYTARGTFMIWRIELKATFLQIEIK